MRLYLAAAERHWREFQELDIRFVLFSFYHLRHNQHLGALLEYLERLSATNTDRRPASVFLDSGAFSLKSGTAHMTDVTLENYVDGYIEFLQRPDTQHIELVAEVDVYQDLVNSEGTVLLEAADRVKQWRDRLYEVVGSRLVPVMTPELDWDECEELCRDDRFNWVAMAALDPDEYPNIVSETCKYINLVHRCGKKIHLFGQTNTQTNFKYLQHADSCDSSTWVSSARHGMVFIHRRGRMDSIDHESKYRRRFYESYYRKIGCDYRQILGTHRDHVSFCDGPDSRTRGCVACADQAQESRKSALIAWRDFASFIQKRLVKRVRDTVVRVSLPLKKGSDMTQETTELTPRIRKTWKGQGVRPLYEEFGGFRCPSFRNRPLDVVANLTCQNCVNFDMCQFVQKAEAAHVKNPNGVSRPPRENPKLASGRSNPSGNQHSDDRDAPGSAGPGDGSGHGSGDSGDDGGRRRRFDSGCPSVSRPLRRAQVPAGLATVERWKPRAAHMPSSGGSSKRVYGDAIKAWLSVPEKFTNEQLVRRAAKSAKITPDAPDLPAEVVQMPDTGSSTGEIPPVEPEVEVVADSDENSGLAGDVVATVEGPSGETRLPSLPIVQDTADKALGLLQSITPNFTCDTCTIESSCPKFAPGEICFFKAPLSNFDSRDPDSLLAMMEWNVGMDFERTFMAATQERVQTGGQIDRRVSEQMDRLQRKTRELLDLKQNLTNADSQGSNRGGVTINNVQVTGSQPGLVARMFSAPPSTNDPRLPPPNILPSGPPGGS